MTIQTPFDHSNLHHAPLSEAQRKIQNIFREIHERKSKALFTLSGAAIILPMLSQKAEAQSIEPVALGTVTTVQSQQVLDDGSVQVNLQNGQSVVVGSDSVTVGIDEAVAITEQAAEELLLAGSEGAAVVPLAGGGAAAAIGGIAILAVLAGGGGGGGGSVTTRFDGGTTPASTLVSKTISVIDAPLKNALVFYDKDLDGNPDELEYLGLTNDSGAIDVTYDPVAGAKFIIVPAPVANAAADYGWSQTFIDSLAGIETRDAVTDNLFSQILTAADSVSTEGQVVSPISTLKDAGLSDAAVKAIFGIPQDVDLDTFNFYEALGSDDADVRAAAQTISKAAVIAANVTKAALAAAGSSQELTAAQQQAVAAKAVQDTVETLRVLGSGNSLEDVAEAATAIAVAGALNPNLDTSQAAADLKDAIGENAGDVGNAIAAEAGNFGLTAEQATGVSEIATAVQGQTAAIEAAFNDVNVADENGSFVKTPEQIEEILKQKLDEADDAIEAGVDVAVNKILGVELKPDVEEAVEDQIEVIKGNVLANDQFSDGTGLPSDSSVQSVNGATIAEPVPTLATSKTFVLSTSDWNTTSGRTVSVSTIADEAGVDRSDFPNARPFGGATRGSAVVATDVVVADGDVLTLDYIFSSRDYIPYTDYSFISIKRTDAAGTEDVIGGADNNSADGPFDVRDLKGPGYYTDAGRWKSATDEFIYTFDSAGTYTISIGVTDVRDTIVDSRLTVNDITIGQPGTDGTDVTSAFSTELGNVVSAETNEEIFTDVTQTLITGNYGSLIIDKTGDYLYQLGGANADPIAEGVEVTDDFDYTVKITDPDTGEVTFATQSLSIKVTGTADPIVGEPTVQISTSPVSAETDEPAVFTGKVTNLPEQGVITLDVSISEAGTTGTTPLTQTITLTNAEPNPTLDADGNFSFSQDMTSLANGAYLVEATLQLDGSPLLYEGGPVAARSFDIYDTDADVGDDISVSVSDVLDGKATVTVAGLDEESDAPISNPQDGEPTSLPFGDANVEIAFTDGTDYVYFSIAEDSSGTPYSVDLSDLDLTQTINYQVGVVDAVGNQEDGGDGSTVSVKVVNEGTGAGYQTIGEAVTAATAGDVLTLGTYTFNEDVVINKALTINGLHAGTTAGFTAEQINALDGTSGPRGEESLIVGTVTIAASDVTIDGVQFGATDVPPLTWDESLLSTSGALDNFTLKNSIVEGYKAADAPTFNAGSSDQPGTYTGVTVAAGWNITDNLFGGVDTSEGNGGALYLSGLSGASISDNTFWRPGAGHMYVSSLTDTTIEGNFFYHGVHAGGADFDGLGANFANSNGEGYGAGYGYGYGYGYGGEGAEDFFGRNFWIEVKGENSDITISGNDGQFNSGGIQLFGEADGYSFDDIIITGNTFRDFVNADPTGILGGGRAQSGFMGAVAVSVSEDSYASGISITNNTIEVAVDQILSARDQLSSIYVAGNVENLNVDDNDISFSAASSSDVLTGLSASGVVPNVPEGVPAVSAVALVGGLDGDVDVTGNTFVDGDVSGLNMAAIYFEGEGPDGFGHFVGSLAENGNTYTGWDNVQSIEVLVASAPFQTALTQYNFSSNDVFLIGTDGMTLVPLLTSDTDVADTIVSTAGSQAYFTGDVVTDSIDLTNSGQDAVLVNVGGAEEEVTGFTFGTTAEDDHVGIFDVDLSELRAGGGSGLEFQTFATSGNVDSDTGLLVFTNELLVGTSIADAVGGLTGTSDGDSFFVLADTGADSVLVKVDIASGGTVTQTDDLINFIGTDLAKVDADNFLNFVLPEA
jgi:VCBS repeat-containing protein